MKKTLLILCLFASPFALNAEETLPLTLQEAYQSALVQSESLGIQEESIRVAEAHYLQGLGSVLPHINLIGTELIQDTAGGGDDVEDTFTRRSRPEVAVRLNQPLFQGFRGLRTLKIAGTEKQRNQLTRDRAKELLFAEVTQAYYIVLEVEKELLIYETLEKTLQKRLGELRGRAKIGKSRPSDLLSTESEIAAVQADMEKTRGTVRTARELINFLTGREITENLVDEFPVPESFPPVDTFIASGRERTDANASKANVRLAKGRVDFEKGAYYPSLYFQGNYYPYRVGFFEDIDWDLSFTLDVPIFQGGLTRGRVKEASSLLQQTKLADEETLRRIDLEVKRAYANLSSSQAREKALRTAEGKARANYNYSSQDYKMGLINNLELLEGLRLWQARQLALNLSHYQTKLAYLELLVASGQLPLSEFEKKEKIKSPETPETKDTP